MTQTPTASSSAESGREELTEYPAVTQTKNKTKPKESYERQIRSPGQGNSPIRHTARSAEEIRLRHRGHRAGRAGAGDQGRGGPKTYKSLSRQWQSVSQ